MKKIEEAATLAVSNPLIQEMGKKRYMDMRARSAAETAKLMTQENDHFTKMTAAAE